MRIAGKIMLFKYFAGEFPDDCVITAHRDPHKCLAVGYGGIWACQICKLPDRERTEPPSSFRHNAPVRGIRANRKNVFLDGLLANRGNGLADFFASILVALFVGLFRDLFRDLGLGRTLSAATAHTIQVHFGKRTALRGEKSTNGEGKPVSLPLRRLRAV